jgi:hypothetical protein
MGEPKQDVAQLIANGCAEAMASQEEARELIRVLRVQANAEQQRAAREFYAQNGDCFLAWVNEGDFLNVTLPRPTLDLGDVDELMERIRDYIYDCTKDEFGHGWTLSGEQVRHIIALRAALDKKD